jgi:hypothetical protein
MLKTYEVLMVEKSYGTVRVQAKTEEEAHHHAIRSKEVEWENPSNVEVVAVREI